MPEIKPRQHQIQGVEIAREKPAFLFAWKPGTGKTFLIYFICKERPMQTVVLAPLSVCETAWTNNARDLGIPIRFISTELGTKAKRTEAIMKCPKNTILVMNYEMFKIHKSDVHHWGVERLVIDESSKIKNRQSQIWEAVVEIADRCKEKYELSGTPDPNSPVELWAQLRVLSRKAVEVRDSFGNPQVSFYAWAYKWFVPVKQRIKGGRTVIGGWLMKPNLKQAFEESLRPWIWYLPKEACIDLPPKVPVIRHYSMTKEERTAYNDMHNSLVAAVKIEGQTVMLGVRGEAAQMKLRQIPSGFFIAPEGHGLVLLGNSKKKALTELLEELGDEPVVIWAEFVHSIIDLNHYLNSHPELRRRSVAVCSGGTRSGEAVRKFLAGEVNTIIAHPAAMGHGTDGLQKICQYAIYYELSFSSEQHEQSQDRLHRAGQGESTVIFYLIDPTTIEAGLYDVVTKKCTAQEALLRELQRPIGGQGKGSHAVIRSSGTKHQPDSADND